MRQKGVVNMFAIILVIICIFFGAFGQISMKKGMTQLEKIDSISDLFQLSVIVDMLTNWYIIVGLLLYAIAAFLWLGALSSLDVSYMYPMLSVGYIITAILAFILFKEDVTLLRWVGIVLIVAGCFLVGRT
jgi:drug/metabolite transporter (DMT)-like permease